MVVTDLAASRVRTRGDFSSAAWPRVSPRRAPVRPTGPSQPTPSSGTKPSRAIRSRRSDQRKIAIPGPAFRFITSLSSEPLRPVCPTRASVGRLTCPRPVPSLVSPPDGGTSGGSRTSIVLSSLTSTRFCLVCLFPTCNANLLLLPAPRQSRAIKPLPRRAGPSSAPLPGCWS